MTARDNISNTNAMPRTPEIYVVNFNTNAKYVTWHYSVSRVINIENVSIRYAPIIRGSSGKK